MPKMILLLFCLFFSQSLLCQQPHSVFFIGDAGNDTLPGKTLLALKNKLEQQPGSMLFFLGDNIYPRGLDGTEEAKQKLLAQLSIIKNFSGEWVFVPGNHDWASGRWKGYKNVMRQQQYLAQFAQDSLPGHTYQLAHSYPADGLPGPSVIEAGKIMFIVTDTDWWLHRQFFHKVGKNASFKQMEQNYLYRLDSALAAAKQSGKIPVFISHHPLVNYGTHAQPNEPWRFLVNYTPFQIFGLLGLNRAFCSENQQPRYKRMSKKLLAVLQKYEPYISVSGHEHNLQYIKEGNAAYIISGSGSKLVGIPAKSFTRPALKFGKPVHGFAELQVKEKSGITVIYWGENGEELYRDEKIF